VDLRAAAAGPLARRFPLRWLAAHGVLPLGAAADGSVTVAAAGTPAAAVHDTLARGLAAAVTFVPVAAGDLQAALLGADRDAPAATAADAASLASDAPVVQLVDTLLAEAVRAGASDVHLEATADGAQVRMRVDGVLHDVQRVPAAYGAGAVGRVKILAGLDVGERRRPQDGRTRITVGARALDVRVATLPALHGESVVLRLLDPAGGARTLEEVGLAPALRARFEALVDRPSGLVVVCGPTGSGKTTTLYAALRRVARPGVKVVTVEDPVEYELPGVVQSPVNPRTGYGFADALRAILRHDPDVILVGEMRDAETARIAVQAALTGHLVLTTLHTTDAPGAVTRLLDMGVEPYLVGATLHGVLAQRLVRTLAPGGDALRGRTGIHELLVLDDPLRDAIARGARGEALRALATAAGWVPLREDGFAKAAAGLTTRDEVLRVTAGDVA
jgi:type II secretory ATPase GspE/PulE/Tfp pilus assembly ATPase PilB-like protein